MSAPSSSADASLVHTGEVRTDMDCHNCSKMFCALVDYSLNGEHIIECAHCGHEHWRTIKDGRVTEARWGTGGNDKPQNPHRPRRTWKANSLPAVTSSASMFMRERWLDKVGR